MEFRKTAKRFASGGDQNFNRLDENADSCKSNISEAEIV